MTNTPNLNLMELTYDNTKKVKDFFTDEIIGKVNSNNTKIDTAIAEKITQIALKSSLPTSPTTSNNLYIVYRDTKNNNGQYRWNGTTYEKISTQLDYATKAEAEAGADNTKVMTPQRVRDFFIANGGGSGGVTNVVFQSGKKYYKFTSTAVTDNFEIPSNLFNPTTDVVELIHGGNIPLIKDENYTLVGNLVTFIGYSLDINDDIHCLITNTAYSYNALVDIPDLSLKQDKIDNELTTIDKTLVGAINEHENNISGINTSLGNKADKQYKKYHNVFGIGWKRIAFCSEGGIASANGIFRLITVWYNSHPTAVTFSAIKNVNDTASLVQINGSLGGSSTITKLRIVHTFKEAFLEVYYNVSAANELDVTLENNISWSLLDTLQEGSVPSGYNVQELTIVDNGMSINGKSVTTSADLEQKADKMYIGYLPVTNILDIPFNINDVRYLINADIPVNAPIGGTGWSTIETKPCSSGRWLELYWFNWGSTPSGNMFSAILDTESKTFVSNWKEIATTNKIDILCTANTGYKIIDQACYRINNIAYIRLRVRKTDNSVFSNGNHNVVTIPVSNRSLSYMPIIGYGLTSDITYSDGLYRGFSHSDGIIYGYISGNTNAVELLISGSYVVIS